MTYIEFFDKTSIDNICSSITNPPERVVFIGDSLKTMQSQVLYYQKVLQNRGISVEFVCKSVNKNKMDSVLSALSSIVEEYENCTIDLTGGEDIFLVAAGIVFEKYKEKNIQMHRFNISNNSIMDCDLDGNTILDIDSPKITVEENIQIYGGDIIYEKGDIIGTPCWNMTDGFMRDIDTMWDICKETGSLWNAQIMVFANIEKYRQENENPLVTKVSLSELNDNNVINFFKGHFLQKLRISGLVIDTVLDEESFTITYKNEQVKKCLTKAGQALEMKVFVTAIRAHEKNGKPTYNDVMNGVCIDWDGDVNNDGTHANTINEVDVIMMHNMVPVFVSCKNGRITIDELYKLTSVANRFGGKYAKKVLIAAAMDDLPNSEHIRERANDMKIKLIENIQDLDEAELQRIINSFWKN